jgi:hypothetical protein
VLVFVCVMFIIIVLRVSGLFRYECENRACSSDIRPFYSYTS